MSEEKRSRARENSSLRLREDCDECTLLGLSQIHKSHVTCSHHEALSTPYHNLRVPIGHNHIPNIITGVSKSPCCYSWILYPWPIIFLEIVRICNQPQKRNTSLFTWQSKLAQIVTFSRLRGNFLFRIYSCQNTFRIWDFFLELHNILCRKARVVCSGCGRGNSAIVFRFSVRQQNFLHCKKPKDQCTAYQACCLVGNGGGFFAG
jgi:hypothetical protein